MGQNEEKAMNRIFTLGELAEMLGGAVVGDAEKKIVGVAPTHLAGPEELTFLTDSKNAKLLDACRAAAVMVRSGTESEYPGRTLLAVDSVNDKFDFVAALFHPVRERMIEGISPLANIDERAKIGADVAIGPGAFIGKEVELGDGVVIYPNAVVLDGSVIGAGSTLFPNAVIYENCRVGERCTIHSGAVIGGYGFGYESSAAGHRISAQLGNVVIEDDVEVGACSTIDRATHGSTRIGQGTKIDNLVMIAHNCRLGRHNLICAHTGIAGSTTTGDFVVMAGRVGVKDHVHIGTGAVLGAMAGIMEDIPEKTQYVGIPATELREQFKKQAALAKLPTMRREFIALQNEVKRLSEKLADIEKK